MGRVKTLWSLQALLSSYAHSAEFLGPLGFYRAT